MAELSRESRGAIDKLVAKYPAAQKQSALISALMVAQQQNNGYLSAELIEQVADYLHLPHIAAYEVASFYSMFNLQPIGQHQISLCTNISCMLRGSEHIAEHLQRRLGIRFGETSADGKFTLKAVECLAACGGAPMMQIDTQYYEDLSVEKVEQILKGLG